MMFNLSIPMPTIDPEQVEEVQLLLQGDKHLLGGLTHGAVNPDEETIKRMLAYALQWGNSYTLSFFVKKEDKIFRSNFELHDDLRATWSNWKEIGKIPDIDAEV